MGIKLVIVDDAPFIREVIKQIASLNGIDVVGEASTGTEAIQVVRAVEPDVVIMDIVMPDKNGIEAAYELLEELPTLAIIACSTLDQDSLMVKAFDAGCVDFIKKPFEADQLVEAILKAGGQSLSLDINYSENEDLDIEDDLSD